MNLHLPQSWIEALGWTLLHSLWQAALIALLARGVAAAFRTRSASLGASIHSLALAAVLIAAAATCAISLVPERSSRAANLPPLAASPAVDLAGQEFALSADFQNASALRGAFPLLVATWAAGVLLMSLRLAAGALWLRRLRREALPWADEHWQAKFRQWLANLGIRRAVRLCTTLAHETPAVIGHFKPLVLIPASLLAKLTPEQLEAVILHELMHVRRHDYLLNILRVSAETVLFFNPAVWWLSGAIRLEREVACDQLVAERTGSKVAYAKTLLRLEELHLAETGRLALAASSGPLKTRVARLLAINQPAPAVALWTAWTGLGCLALLLVALSASNLSPSFAADAGQARFELRSVVEAGTAGAEILPIVRTAADGRSVTNELAVAKRVLLSNRHFASVQVVHDPLANRPEIRIRLTPEGAQLFAAVTREHVRRQIAIVIDGKIVSAPIVNEPITGGSLTISGSFTEKEAQELARKLSPEKSGAQADGRESLNSPAWEPPAGAVPSKVLEEARADRDAGRYEQALARHLWYHTASRQEPGQGGVRLSFALSDWLSLGQAYPPALARLKQLRDETEQALRTAKVEVDRFTLFHEFAGLNWVLHEEEKTAALYLWLEKEDPDLARMAYRVALPSLIKTGQNKERSDNATSERNRFATTEYNQLNRLLGQLKALEAKEGRGELRHALPTVFPDGALDRLLAELSKTEQALVSLTVDRSDEHPEVRQLKEVSKVINRQIEERIDGIMKGLAMKVSLLKAATEELEKR